MLALIDGDILVYRCGFAVEKTRYVVYKKGEEEKGPVQVYGGKREIPPQHLTEDFIVDADKVVEPVENALQATKELLESIISATGATSWKLYLTGEGNFREKIAVTLPYKGNRDSLHKPVWYKEIKEYLIGVWKAEVVNGMEADDALGIQQIRSNTFTDHPNCTCDRYVDFDVNQSSSIICSIDKDLDQIPGWHYNFTKKEKYWVTEFEADKNFYIQMLTGDRVDNIPGLKGIGPKTAEKLLEKCGTVFDLHNKCREIYEECMFKAHDIRKVWLPESVDVYFIEMYNLLYILRDGNDIPIEPMRVVIP